MARGRQDSQSGHNGQCHEQTGANSNHLGGHRQRGYTMDMISDGRTFQVGQGKEQTTKGGGGWPRPNGQQAFKKRGATNWAALQSDDYNTLMSGGGHAQLFFESAIAILQLEGSTSAIAIPQLFKKCCSATATPQFRNRNFFLNPQIESFNSAIFSTFLAVESGRFMGKKSEVKNLMLLSL
jgi:hypothetical protein